jgi:hypothetical protein
MNAEQQTPPPAPVPGPAPTVPPGPPAPQTHTKPEALVDPDNSLVRLLKNSWQAIKTGQIGSPKVLAISLAVILGGGIGWWLWSQSSSTASSRWSALVRANGPSTWEQIAKDNPKDVTGKLARLEQARRMLTTEGIDKLISERKKADRAKAIANIEAAREELLKLSEDLGKDLTLKATCLTLAADAEMTLVGWPKEGSNGLTDNPEAFRGTVARAVELLTKARDVVGPKSPAGELLTKRLEEIEPKQAEILQVQRSLYEHLAIWEPVELPVTPVTPKTPEVPKTPTVPMSPETPKTPDPIPAPKPPDMLPKAPEPIPTPKAPEPMPKSPEPAPTPKTM